MLNKLTIIFTLYFSLYKTSLFCCYCKTRVLLQHDPAHSSWRAPDVAPFQDRTTNTRKLDLWIYRYDPSPRILSTPLRVRPSSIFPYSKLSHYCDHKYLHISLVPIFSSFSRTAVSPLWQAAFVSISKLIYHKKWFRILTNFLLKICFSRLFNILQLSLLSIQQ